MGQQYSIVFNNRSAMTPGNSFCCFQQDVNVQSQGALALAWYTKVVNPAASAIFDWTIDYSFIWAESGILKPGVTFSANQVLAAGLSSHNAVILDYNGGYQFITEPAKQAGSLFIDTSTNVPNLDTVPLGDEASVGIGMSGTGTFALQVQGPNVHYTFTPTPTYWVAFGEYEVGQVLSEQVTTNAAQVTFAPGVYTMYVTLDVNNNWNISSAPTNW